MGGRTSKEIWEFYQKIIRLHKGLKDNQLGHAINNFTSKTALVLGIKDRGYIKPGYFAEIILFDLELLGDNATNDAPYHFSEGMGHVMANLP